jgi:lysozyme family protein
MTQSNFQTALAFTLKQEGGWADDPDDPGGATNQGITLATYTAWRSARGYASTTVDDLKAMPDSERDQIYVTEYWTKIDGDELPSGIDLAMFDFAVNAYWATAARHLQACVGTLQDGVIGPITLAAVKSSVTHDLITRLTDSRVEYYTSLNKSKFIEGWTKRADACEVAAMELIE